ncbi:MAG: type II secretion system protein GspM [Pseudomonadota bacterium]
MISALSDFLAGRSQRERWLLGLLMLVVVPFVYVYSVVLPLNEQMDAEERALQEALALERWLVERRAEFSRLPEVPEATGQAIEDRPLPGLGEIEVRLEKAGLDTTLGLLASADFGGIEMGFEDVPFTDLMPWLDALLAETGYALNRLTLIRSEDDGLVDADILLLPL